MGCALAGLLAAAAVAAADPAPDTAPVTSQADTDYTPVAKAPPARYGWQQVGGSVFAPAGTEPRLAPGSPTPPTIDFYDVAFSDKANGLAVGAACPDGTPTAQLATCTRTPAAWSYTTDSLGVSTWSRVDLPIAGADGKPAPGYIAAVAWIGPGEAIAVGGDGAYVRRESGTAVDDPSYSDPAGRARVWLLQDGGWSELSRLPAIQHADGTSVAMRGLSAVACSTTEDRVCEAGGLAQLWTFRDGQFVKGYDAQTDGFENAGQFRFRVRQIAFNTISTKPQFVAVTSGCCARDGGLDVAEILTFDGTWHAPAKPCSLRTDKLGAGSLPGTGATCVSAGQGTPPPAQTMSYYGLTIVKGAFGADVSLLEGPDGPVGSVHEPSARVLLANGSGYDDGTYNLIGLAAGPASTALVGDLRLVAGDGDLEAPCQPMYGGCSPPHDWWMDWAVGSMAAGANAGQAIAYTTAPSGQRRSVGDYGAALDCPPTGPTVIGVATPGNPANCRPRSPQEVDEQQVQSQRAFLLPSFALNGYKVVPGTDVAWAVGDRGALLTRSPDTSAAGTVAGSEVPPQVGAPEPTPTPDLSPYAGFRPALDGAPGEVPALATRPLRQLATPVVIPGGSSDEARPTPTDVTAIVMSRDGSEGWAVGPDLALSHYDGLNWTLCDPDGIRGILAADSACAALAPLAHYVRANGPAPVQIQAMARIPMENGPDPGNADDFEVVAVGTSYSSRPGQREHPVVLRYRKGRWAPEEDGETAAIATADQGMLGLTDIAFTAPDDGWMTADDFGNVGPGGHPAIFHYDGTRWVDCAVAKARGDLGACSDVGGRLPFVDTEYRAKNPVRLRLATAGGRVYVFGTRVVYNSGGNAGDSLTGLGTEYESFPLVLYRDRGQPCAQAADPGCWRAAEGGYDPGFGATYGQRTADQGRVYSLAVARRADGSYAGWAVGRFGNPDPVRQRFGSDYDGVRLQDLLGNAPSSLLRLDGTTWSPWPISDAAQDYLSMNKDGQPPVPGQLLAPRQQVELPDGQAVIAANQRPLLAFGDPGQGGAARWRVMPAPFNLAGSYATARTPSAQGLVRAMAPDGHGGLWLAVHQKSADGTAPHEHVFFYHQTRSVPEPVFSEVAHPIRDRIHGLTGTPDGGLWAAADVGNLYRYDRVGGWAKLHIKGWDGGRLVTNSSPVYAVAAGPDGTGVAVGPAGRIADLQPGGARLNVASGLLCSQGTPAPCSTSRSLRAAAVAPDGSAMVGGDHLSLLYRPGHGAFAAIDVPKNISAGTVVTGIAMPRPEQAWITTDNGAVFAGRRDGGGVWDWSLESQDAQGVNLTKGRFVHPEPLRAIALDASGRGFAVGDGGVVLQRTGDGDHPWRRLATGFLYDLTSVALPVGGGSGALVGGDFGLVLTYVGGRFAVAHEADPYDGIEGSIQAAPSVAGVALLPATGSGAAEAWAVVQGAPGPLERPAALSNAVLHYSSDPADGLLDGGAGRVLPLPDAPGPVPGEVTFAAFGKSDCGFPADNQCPEPTGTNLVHEVVSRRIVDRIAATAGQPGGPAFTVFTGDANDAAGEASASTRGGKAVALPTDRNLNEKQWVELVAQRLDAAGAPVFGAIGAQDLNADAYCSLGNGGNYVCTGSTRTYGATGLNLGWRQAASSRPAPWGVGAPVGARGLTFVPVPDPGQEISDRHVDDPSGTTSGTTVEVSGAHTHYAVDVERGGQKLLRLVVVDTSLRSLATGDPFQNPAEAGGQAAWLRSMVCIKGSAADSSTTPCSRPASERAVVVSETPTYSYGPGTSRDIATDAATFETTLFQNRVDAVVSGRLGWNGLYYATAPGIHEPCPGQRYPDHPPAAETAAPCSATTGSAAAPDAQAAAARLAGALRGAGAPAPPAGTLDATSAAGAANVSGVLPFVVASGAGGKFGPNDELPPDTSGEGYWHGYSVVRVQPGGGVIVEQRPVFDWVGMSAVGHVLHPGQRIVLHGYGREAVGVDAPVRYDDISGPAITHRYDLLEADPQRPWLPRVVEGNGNPHGYVPLDPSVATVDDGGRVRAARSDRGRVYAIAVLSVGEQAASFPLVFEPRRSYVAKALRILPPTVVPEVRVLGLSSVSISAPPAAPPASAPPPINVGLELPAPPALPGLPSGATPLVTPPVPPAPPAPPGGQHGLPGTLSIAPTGITVPPTTGVTAQPTPPVNPSPPGGARKEARQKQAATAKSEEGGSPGAQDATGDLAGSPDTTHGSKAMTRRDRIKPAAVGFTPRSRAHAQPSAWTTGLEWGGGIGLMALALAFGFTTLRPTPRRRTPQVPAAAWARVRD